MTTGRPAATLPIVLLALLLLLAIYLFQSGRLAQLATSAAQAALAQPQPRPGAIQAFFTTPALVYPDSDTDATAHGVIAGMRFTRQGQGCTAGSRLFVHESIFDSFIGRLIGHLEKLRIGDPLDEATDIGSLISQKQLDRVCGYIEDGLSHGSKPVIGGLPDTGLPDGYFVRPTIFTQVEPGWRIVREEIFGPVLVAIPWSDEDEAIAMANDTHYGLGAYIWCQDISRALRAVGRLDAGTVQINRGNGPMLGMSSGGIKASGFGREHSLEAVLDDFTYRKCVVVGLG